MTRRFSGGRRTVLRVTLLALALGAVFALGIALGQALESSPEVGPSQTRVRTIVPVPATRETVTVTTTVEKEPGRGQD